MKKVEFANGFYAELSSPDRRGERIARLYTPDDVCIASMPSSEEALSAASQGMMYGYFCGFRDCRHKIKAKLFSAIDSVSIIDIKR